MKVVLIVHVVPVKVDILKKVVFVKNLNGMEKDIAWKEEEIINIVIYLMEK